MSQKGDLYKHYFWLSSDLQMTQCIEVFSFGGGRETYRLLKMEHLNLPTFCSKYRLSAILIMTSSFYFFVKSMRTPKIGSLHPKLNS